MEVLLLHMSILQADPGTTLERAESRVKTSTSVRLRFGLDKYWTECVKAGGDLGVVCMCEREYVRWCNMVYVCLLCSSQWAVSILSLLASRFHLLSAICVRSLRLVVAPSLVSITESSP